MAAAGHCFPPIVVDRIGRFLPGFNPAYCLLQRGAVQAFLAMARAPMANQRPHMQPPQQDGAVTFYPVDLDMSFCKIHTMDLPEHTLLDYVLLQQPLLKILPERQPDLIQLCPYPLAVFVEVPAGQTMQSFKAHLCNTLWCSGAEQPFPTGADAFGLCKTALKIQSSHFKSALLLAGVSVVYIGRYGMKHYLLPDPQTALASIPDIADTHAALDLGIMSRDVNHIWLFGIAPNHQGLWHDHRNRISWRVLPLVPGCQRFEDGFIYGTLEGRPMEGPPFGNDLGKMLQVYSLLHHTKLALTNVDPNFPSHMYDMINRREALESYTGQLIQNVAKACGG
ncbi:hypothetical protein AK812_SmicGene47431, partial [Symbiodinium microadriaticum]